MGCYGLAQFQAKESTYIPNDVFDRILVEIKKERITNMALLTPQKLRQILKKLNQTLEIIDLRYLKVFAKQKKSIHYY